MSGIPRCISLKRWAPANNSRRMMGVHRSANTSQATATGQNCPKPGFRITQESVTWTKTKARLFSIESFLSTRQPVVNIPRTASEGGKVSKDYFLSPVIAFSC